MLPATPRLKRLSGRNRFTAILAQKRSARGQYLQLFRGDATSVDVELGISVAKAVAKFANKRNYMRRVTREELRVHLSALPPMQLVVLVRKAFDRHTRGEVIAELDQLLERLRR